MESSAARTLTEAFYRLRELEFFDTRSQNQDAIDSLHDMVLTAGRLGDRAFHNFARELVARISAYCLDESKNSGVLDRAFDGLDEIFEIDYSQDFQMPEGNSKTRLYPRAGAAVQTSYATIFRALAHAQFAPGAHLVDLGSGYGRIGLAAGLLREDIRFTGFEYVHHRVAASRHAHQRAGLDARVTFAQQDLSELSFQIPEADAYYLYDPFDGPTYARVITRIDEIARIRPVLVLAKDGARGAFTRSMDAQAWLAPVVIDEGTMFLFRSKRP